MALGAALAIGKAGFAIGKNIAARVKRKKAMDSGAALVDPNMQAMKSVLTRKRRGLEIGSSRKSSEAGKGMKNALKIAAMSGGKNFSAISKAMSDTEGNIAKEEGALAQGLLEQEGKFTQAISDRKMDLVEADKYQKIQDASGDIQNSGKNIQSSLPGALRKGKKAMEMGKLGKNKKKPSPQAVMDIISKFKFK